ncbi:MAG: EI24 domain-containing protein [Saprospiraceae bacterium]
MIKGFFDGVTAYAKAFTLISEMRLWKYLIVPGFISILLGAAIFGVTFGLAGVLGAWLISWYPFDWGLEYLTNISAFIGGFILLTGGFILYKHLVMVIVSPFMSPLSQKIEAQMTGQPTKNTGFNFNQAIKDFGRGLLIAFRNIFKEFFYVLLLLLLGLLPILNFLSPILIFATQAFYAGFGNMDYTLERHFNVRNSARFVKNHRGLAIGNGTVFLLLLMTGVGFFIAPPLATIAATVESVKRLEQENLLALPVEEYV